MGGLATENVAKLITEVISLMSCYWSRIIIYSIYLNGAIQMGFSISRASIFLQHKFHIFLTHTQYL